MIDIMSINAQALIAFGVLLIAGLLMYMAFGKDSTTKDSSHKRK